MQSDLIHEGCSVIRYGDKKYLLCTPEVTHFLINCDALGLRTPEEIALQIDLTRDMVLDLKTEHTAEQMQSLRLLKEISLSLRGCLFPDPV